MVPQSAKETSSATVAATSRDKKTKKEEQNGSSPSTSYFKDVVGITTHAHENGLAVMTDKKSGAQD